MQNKKQKKSPLIPIVVIIVIILIAVYAIIVMANQKQSKNPKAKNKTSISRKSEVSNTDGTSDAINDSLIGTFAYEEDYTKYTFNEDGTGSMSSDEYNFNYDYKYSIDGDILSIDFTDDKVQDAKYTFEINGDILKLTAKEGTVSIGEEYILKKESK